MKKLLAWWSARNESIAVDMDPLTAARLDAYFMRERGTQKIIPPDVVQFHDALKGALKECPPEKR